MSITPVTSTPQAGLATDSQSRAGERQNVGKQLRQVLSEQRDSMTRMLSQARQQADESTKASARQRLNLLKEQVKLMRTLMAGLPPKQQKAMAAQLKQMAQELKQLARQLDTGGGDAGVDVSLSTGGLAAAGRNEAGAAEGEDASAAAEAQQLGVTVIPLNVTLEDGTVLRDGIDMTPSEYYTHLAACRKLPTTSQPSPEQFERLYLDAAAAGDEVLGIFLSDALSGTGQCARLAADLANVDNVVFVNTENVCLGQSLLVRLAVQLRDAGKTITQIAADLEKAKQHLHLVAAVDDLKYLRKGGRLSAAAAVAGGMLGIKPILAVMEGKVALAGKARGLPGVYVALFKKIDEMGGIHPGYTPLLGYTVNHRELQPLLTYLQDNLHLDAPLVRQIGCVIGTHTGPGAFGIAFFDKELVLE